LVSAYYFQSYPNDNFCSAVGRHSIFLERIPIRLEDVEHVPYPDYLHLFDAALKGYAQLARCVGFFPVEEAMIGINEHGVVKSWLNEDFANSRPFRKATEAQMVSSLVEAIDRNIDHDQLPPSTPTVRNFLYRNADALNFDNAIWEFGEFVRLFNSGQVPIRLDCIDEAGGVYAIANRNRETVLKKSDVRRSQVKEIQMPISNPPPKMMAIPINSERLPPPAVLNNQAYAIQPQPQPQPQPQIQAQYIHIPVSTHSEAGQPIFFSPIIPAGQAFTPRVSNAPKFTVEVVPGKVYPQKSSTIFMNGSSKVIPTGFPGTKQVSLLDKIHPRIATS
jgi:hypothetical protein